MVEASELAARIQNMVRYNTSPCQPDAMKEAHIKGLACSNIGYSPSDVDYALQLAVERGLLERTDGGRYKPAGGEQ